MKSPTEYKSGLVAILDALGAAAYGRAEIDRFMRSRDIVLGLAREKAEDTLNVDLLSIFTFNDTIVFGLQAENNRPTIREASAFFQLLRKFMVDSLRNGILFRGAIAIGTFYADKDTNTVMGEAVTDAASWYTKANWIGVHATPRTTILLNGLLEKEKKKRDYVMVNYPVPMKGRPPVQLKVVNWPKALFVRGLVPVSLRETPRANVLSWFGRQPIPDGAEEKCFNAIAFFDKIVKTQRLTPAPDTGK
jgi:hypothetical protein